MIMKKNTGCNIRLSSPIHLLAVGFGSGLSPYFPGTVGSLVAILLWFPLNLLTPLFFWLAIILATVVGVWICQKTSDDLKEADPSCIVWDEFVGMWITLYFIPHSTITWIVIAFVLFRLFDILKPWPIRYLDRNVGGGFGIMIDDIIAGFMAAVCITILIWLF